MKRSLIAVLLTALLAPSAAAHDNRHWFSPAEVLRKESALEFILNGAFGELELRKPKVRCTGVGWRGRGHIHIRCVSNYYGTWTFHKDARGKMFFTRSR